MQTTTLPSHSPTLTTVPLYLSLCNKRYTASRSTFLFQLAIRVETCEVTNKKGCTINLNIAMHLEWRERSVRKGKVICRLIYELRNKFHHASRITNTYFSSWMQLLKHRACWKWSRMCFAFRIVNLSLVVTINIVIRSCYFSKPINGIFYARDGFYH